MGVEGFSFATGRARLVLFSFSSFSAVRLTRRERSCFILGQNSHMFWFIDQGLRRVVCGAAKMIDSSRSAALSGQRSEPLGFSVFLR